MTIALGIFMVNGASDDSECSRTTATRAPKRSPMCVRRLRDGRGRTKKNRTKRARHYPVMLSAFKESCYKKPLQSGKNGGERVVGVARELGVPFGSQGVIEP